MVTYFNIFVKTLSLEALLAAWDEFKQDKRTRADVQMFERHLEDNLFELHSELVSKTYKHSSYRAFTIHDPKVRQIHKATVRDRIVHHAVFNALNPLFEPTFIADSYSCRKDKGTHRAVKRLKVFLEKTGKTYRQCFVLKCDVRKFFQSIDHDILLGIISKRIKDPEMLWLVQELVESFSTEPNRERERERGGYPIGNLTSQLFANVYLNELDQFVKHSLKEKWYIRYTDDFVVVHHSEEHLEEVRRKIEKFLQNSLRLELHPDKVTIRKYSQGVDFLGYVHLPFAQVLRTKTKRRLIRKLREKAIGLKRGKISENSFDSSFQSYMGVLGHANTYELEQKIRQELWELLKGPEDV